ncbi:synaptogenesis protein syg-2-like [Antedon mediterranea]|uniref:synaptogenesis protein syg-2-like n=1 Tax=Antedon mediterranea TaxID=105859 RepID=UPI003AF41C53
MMLLLWVFKLLILIWFINGEKSPVFKIDPSEYQSNEGDQIVLSCTVDISTLSQQQQVVWRRDNDIISIGIDVKEMYRNHFELKVDNGIGMYTLVITKAVRSDANYKYSCAVVDGYKVLAETIAVGLIITAIPAPQFPECNARKDQHREGESITMTCTSEKVIPPVNLRWYHYGKLLNPGETPNINGDLIVSIYSFKLNKDNNGDVYICSQISSLKVTRNCTIGPIDVLYRPIVSMQNYISIEEGSEALLVCSASSNPSPFVYTWSFIPHIDHQFFQLENMDQVLRITNVKHYMNGTTVTCSVANEIGAGYANSFLIVKDAFVVLENPIVQTVEKLEPDDRVINSTAILSIAGGLLLFTALLVAVSLCYFHMCKRGIQMYESNYRIAQPEVYFEPKDVSPLPLHPREGVYLKRHVAIQVSPDMDDESVYAEIEEVSYKTMIRYSSATYSK